MDISESNIESLLEGELEPLLVSVLDQSASNEEFQTLVEALRNSERLRNRVCRFLCDESLLSDQIGATQQATRLVGMLSSAEKIADHDSKASSRRRDISFIHRFSTYVNDHGLAVAALALIAISGLFAHNMLISSKLSRLHELALRGDDQPDIEVVRVPSDSRDDGSSVSNSTKVVGHVIGLHDIAWREKQRELDFGDTLHEGQRINIAAGGMEVLLANGAKITAEGPVDFEVTSLVTMDLDLGKVVAAVPRTARGYTIFTPTTEIVDIGTQFGISVDESGDTEVHVFDGDVVARSLLDHEDAELIHARENEAVGFDGTSPTPRSVTNRENDFLRQLGPIISSSEMPPLPTTDNLSLWYVAEMIRDVPEGEKVSVWRDVLIGDNIFANDARQLQESQRPTFIRDKKGRAALEFDGIASHLLIDPMECDGSMTVFVVCAPSSTETIDEFHGGFLFKHGIAPSLELSVLRSGVPRGWVWPGPTEDRVGIVQGTPVSKEAPTVIAYRYDTARSRAQVWKNGVEQANSAAPIKLSSFAPACLGGYCDPGVSAYYCGTIYEVAVFNGALNDSSMTQLNDYVMDRYLNE